MLDIALDYAKRGWHVFPVTQNKIPFPKTHGHKEACCDEKKIRALWDRFPKANVAIATGKKSGVFVLDVDVKECKVGDESLRNLEKEFGELPQTVECITWSGGRQIYFRYPENIEIFNSQSKVGQDLDIRGEGGYVVAPGSAVNGKTYEWEASCHPDDVKIADAPQWLIDKCIEANKKQKYKLPDGDIPQGTQDDQMFRFACSLKAQGFEPEMVRSALIEALKKCPQDSKKPFTEKDIERWIASAFGYKDDKPKRQRKSFDELKLALQLKAKHTIIYSEDGKFYRYLDGYYQYFSEHALVDLISLEFGCLKNNVINLIIRYVKAKSEVKADMLNNDNSLNLENGLFDLTTYQIKPHSPHVYSTIRLNMKYDSQAKCPLWEEAVRTIIGDAEYINIIQEFFGLCMTRETYDKALFLIGEGNNGKSTLLDVLKGILGNDNTCEVQLEQLEKSHYVAQLHNKILNIATEIGARGTVCDEMFKKIVAHDYVMGDHKFAHPFSFRPVCKLIFATNNMPRTDDKSRAFYRRLLIIPLTKEFTDLDDKHKYYRTLLEERNGIFNWMVEGLKRLKERGRFAVGKNMIETIESYKVENNPVLSFIEEHCVVESIASVIKRDIYEAYKDYCDDSGFKPVNIKKFGKELKRHLQSNVFEGHDSTGKGRQWQGIRLRTKQECEDVRPY